MTEVRIHGVIGGDVSGSEVAAQIAAADGGDVALHLHTPGGSIFDASAIIGAIRAATGRVTAFIDGGAASMGALIALEADEIVMHAEGMLVFHQPRNGGTLADLEGALPMMREFHEAQIAKLTARTGMERAEVESNLAGDWILTGTKAAHLGLATLVFAEKMAADLTWDGFPGAALKCQEPEKILEPVQSIDTKEPEAVATSATPTQKNHEPTCILVRKIRPR